MRRFLPKGAHRMIGLFAAACAAAFALLQITGAVFDIPEISAFARSAGSCEVRLKMAMQALDSLGACSSEEAAASWAEGVKMRNAAMQYSMMDAELKKAYAARLEKTAPNWVSGVSSPYISGWAIQNVLTQDGGSAVTLSFDTATSAGPAKTYQVVLIIRLDEKYYRISQIQADEGFGAYTGM